MSANPPHRVEAIFQKVVDLRPSEQSRELARLCGSDRALRTEVEILLHASETVMRGFLETGALREAGSIGPTGTGADTSADPSEVAEETPPKRIGRYRVIRRIGEGGMGTVYLAEQHNPKRVVALKVIRPGYATGELIKRFEREAQVLGQLQHPGIAQIYEAGFATLDHGQRPFFAMEFIDGPPLDVFVERRALGTRERLELFARICDAVQHAHHKGIIHRDLKPANILVIEESVSRSEGAAATPDLHTYDPTRTRADAGFPGQPKILDFGIARVTDADIQIVTLQTDVGRLVGTLPYMSPEQVLGDSSQLDTRCDVYALGVILYELLAGRLPHDVRRCSVPEATRIIREEEPSRLSSVDSMFRGDIETIVAKALDKDRERRYQSAAELASDVRRYLRDEPIIARSASSLYQLRKFAMRNRGLVSGLAAALVILVVGLVGMTWLAASEARQRKLAHESEQLAQRNLDLAQRRSYVQSIHAAEAALDRYDVMAARLELDRASAAHRGWEWHHFRSRLDDSLVVLHTDPAPSDLRLMIFDIGMTRDQQRLSCVTWSPDRPSSAWLLESYDLTMDPPALLRRMPLPGSTSPGLTPDAEHFVYRAADGQLRIMDTATGEHGPVEGVDAAGSFGRGTFALHLETLRVLERSAGQLSIVDAATSSRHPLPDNRLPQLWYLSVFSSDGALLAYPVGRLERSEILVWDAERTRLLHALTGPRDTVGRLAFSPDNRRLAAVSADHALRQWDLETGLPTWANWAPQHNDAVQALAYSPDGSLIATGSKDRTVRLWDSATGQSVAIYVGHQSEIAIVKFSSEGSRLISASVDGEIRLWDVTGRPDPRIFAGHTLYVYGVAVSPDGARVVSAAWDGTVRIWDADSGDPVAVLPLSPGRRIVIRALAWHPDGSQIAVYDTDLDPPHEVRLRIIEPSTGASRIVFAPLNPGLRSKVAYNRSGSRLVLSDTEAGHAVILETSMFGEVGRVTGNGPCAISPAGPNLLATTSPDNRILLFDADSLELVTELAGHDRPIWDMAFSADGRYLASGGEDRVVKVWDTATGEQLTELRGHTDRVFAVTFSPDGSRIASGSDDHSIRLWDTASFAEVCHLHGHEQYVYSLAFSPDGQRLYSGSGDSTVRVWELDPLRKRIAARLLRRQLVAKLQPLISRLFEDYGAVHDVLTRLRQDALLGDREREVALQLTLAEAVRRRTQE